MTKRRVLFLCIGNSCRSQMAEGFARTYGSDVIAPMSAGFAPAMTVSPLTKSIMREKNIDLSEAVPKGIHQVPLNGGVDLIVNMSGGPMPSGMQTPVEDWEVRDPIGESEDVFRAVAADIEARVMRLVLGLRSENEAPKTFDRRGSRLRQ